MPNRLANEVSPYLQQHKDNPVDWYPWGAEALAKAKSEARDFYAAIAAGYIGQNVYLYCASAGLATVVHELNRAPLAPLLCFVRVRLGQ